ncbi:MAG TPA: hypothetical protein PLY93_08465, partial [Turneriella sp.]|nr:hypothetical protein [Turneriella sp.]
MADEQPNPEQEVVSYTPEELQTIQELIEFFNNAPGQVTVDVDQNVDISDENPPEVDDALDLSDDVPDVSKRPVADLSKFDDIMNMDVDNFDAPPEQPTEIQDVPLVNDAPLDGMGDIPLAQSDGSDLDTLPDLGATDMGDADALPDLAATDMGNADALPDLAATDMGNADALPDLAATDMGNADAL